MLMTKQIVWSPLAENDFAIILAYLNENWDNKVTTHFIDLVENLIRQISINPVFFEPHRHTRAHRKGHIGVWSKE